MDIKFGLKFNKFFTIICVIIFSFIAIPFNDSIKAEKTNDLSIKGIWGNTFGSTDSEQYEAVQMNIDGTYIVAGSTAGNNYDVAGRNHGIVDGILAKYDKDGNLIWSKIVGGNNEDYFSEVKVLRDGRIAVAGYTESSNSGDVTHTKYGYDSAWLIVFDKDGNKLWSQVSGRSNTYGYAAYRGITQTSDGNIVCVGYAFGEGDGNIPGTIKGERDTFIIKFDSNTGTKLWHKFNGGTKNETFFDVMELANGNLVAVGQSQSNDGDFAGKNKGGYDAISMVFSSTGNLVVTNTFGGSADDNFVAVKKTSKNKIVVAGNTLSKDGDINTRTFAGRDGIFVSFSNDGVYEWQKIVGGNGDDYLTYMSEGVNGDISVVGYTNSTTSGSIVLENDGGYDGLFTVLDGDNGEVKHIVLFGGADDDSAEMIAATPSGGYIVVGHTRSQDIEGMNVDNKGSRDALIVKFKTNNVPLLEVPGFTEINVGENLDLMAGVICEDFEDGDLLNKVRVTTTFDKNVAGVYPVEYTVKDFENNEVTLTRVVLVNDGRYKAGANSILYSNDYTINRGQVVLDKTDVTTRADVKVYSKEDASVSENLDDVNVNYGLYTNVIGLYDLTFSLISEPTTSVISKANVIKGADPVLTINTYKEINLNEFFDPYAGLSAIDSEDHDITNKVIIENFVNNNEPGIYEVKYMVTDSDYNTVTNTQYVIVKGESIQIGTNYVIEAHNYQLFVGKVTATDEEVKEYSDLRVYDKINHQYITNPAVTINGNGYTNTVADYNIAITLDAEPTLTKTVVASVVSGAPPAIRGASFTELTLGCTFDNLEGVVISDDEDDQTTLHSNLVITGSVDTSVAGIYNLTYTLTDTDFNTVVVNRVVVVNDGTYKVGQTHIIKANDYSIKSREVVVANSDIIARAGVVAYRKSTGLIDRNADIVVTYGQYSNVVNIYPISFRVKVDKFASRTINADVNIGEAPVITGESILNIAPSDIVDFSHYISVTDLEQGNMINDVVMDGVFVPNQIGVYPVTYTVQDIDGNITTFSQIIIVNDGSIKTTKDYFVAYSSFEINAVDVDTSREAILAAGKVRIWDKLTGEELPLDIIEVDKKSYTNVGGVYPIMLSITTDRSLYDFIYATVIEDVIPVVPPTPLQPENKLISTGFNASIFIVFIFITVILELFNRKIKKNR